MSLSDKALLEWIDNEFLGKTDVTETDYKKCRKEDM